MIRLQHRNAPLRNLILYLKELWPAGCLLPAAETPAWPSSLQFLGTFQQILIAKGDLRLQVLAMFLQHSLTQDIGIKLADLCKLDNLFSDSFPQNALFARLKSWASHFECDGHDPLGLGIEFGTVQKLRDGHDPAPLSAMVLCKSRV